jgi:hypothetical protein
MSGSLLPLGWTRNDLLNASQRAEIVVLGPKQEVNPFRKDKPPAAAAGRSLWTLVTANLCAWGPIIAPSRYLQSTPRSCGLVLSL